MTSRIGDAETIEFQLCADYLRFRDRGGTASGCRRDIYNASVVSDTRLLALQTYCLS